MKLRRRTASLNPRVDPPDLPIILTEREREAVVMALKARMRTETGTFYELLRRVVERLEPPDA